MAEPWIKMRTDLYRDPKVCMMAEIVFDPQGQLARSINQNFECEMAVTRNVTRNAIVGGLVSVWGVMRVRGERKGVDLICPGVDVFVVDDIAELPGLGNAMIEVGWLTEDDVGVVLPGFFRTHNVEPESPAEKQKRYRENKKKRNAEVTKKVTKKVTDEVTDVTSSLPHPLPREEKRREEKNKGDLSPLNPLAGAPASDPATEPEPTTAKPKSPRKRDELFDAIAEITGTDPKASGSHVAKVAAALRKAEPPFTPAEVFRFVEISPQELPWLEGRKPTLGEVEKYIGRVRNPSSAKSATGAKPRGKFESPSERMVRHIAEANSGLDPENSDSPDGVKGQIVEPKREELGNGEMEW